MLGRGRLGATVGVASLAMAAASWAWVFGQGQDPPVVPASTGIYDEAQADEGRAAFARHCASCHGADMSGGFGPRLVPLDPFAYRDQPLAKPFAFMRSAMPFDAPGSLADEVYAAILAHVLRENGYPSGDEPLPSDVDGLTGFVLDDPPAE